MWLVSCSRQGMLTQGPAPDLKCNLIISTFLTLPHLLDCLICTCSLYYYKQWGYGIGGGGEGERGGRWWIYIRVWVGRQALGIILQFMFLYSAFTVCCLAFSVPLFSWLEHDGCCVCLFVFPSFFSLSLVPLTRSYHNHGQSILRQNPAEIFWIFPLSTFLNVAKKKNWTWLLKGHPNIG